MRKMRITIIRIWCRLTGLEACLVFYCEWSIFIEDDVNVITVKDHLADDDHHLDEVVTILNGVIIEVVLVWYWFNSSSNSEWLSESTKVTGKTTRWSRKKMMLNKMPKFCDWLDCYQVWQLKLKRILGVERTGNVAPKMTKNVHWLKVWGPSGPWHLVGGSSGLLTSSFAPGGDPPPTWISI